MEKTIPLNELFKLAARKDRRLCSVRFCRKPRRKCRSLCQNHHQIAWRLRNPTKAAYANIRQKARQRGIRFALEFAYFEQLVRATAEATGMDYVEGRGRSPGALQIDRIDFTKGYEPGNLRVTTTTVNAAKAAVEKKLKLLNGDYVDLHEVVVPPPVEREEEPDEWYEDEWTDEVRDGDPF